jgi:cell division protein FtsW
MTTVVVGLVLIYSASSIMAASRFGTHLYFVRQQFLWAALSVGVIWLIGKLDLKRLAVYSAPALMFCTIALAAVFLMPVRNGSHRWLFLGPLTVQPSEVYKFVMIIYLAFSLSNPRRNLTKVRQVALPYLPLIGLGLALIMAEPDLGSVLVIAMTAMSVFFLAGVRIKHLAYSLLPVIGASSFLVFVLGYKKARVLDRIAAIFDPMQASYQAKQAALTLGSGGLLGAGLGDGRQKLFFLPYPHTDFVFAAAGEEIGMLGLLFVLALLGYILWSGFRIGAGQPDKFGFLLACGMTLSLFISIAVNIGVVTSLIPVTGLPLPFLSYGGSSLLMCSAAVGVLINLSRRTRR